MTFTPIAALLFTALSGWSLAAPRAAQEAAPLFTVNDDCPAFAFGPGQRVAYATRHVFNALHFSVERDDFFVRETGGKERRILNGKLLVSQGEDFSYIARAIHWSPGGSKFAAELFTTAVVDRRGNTKDQSMTLLLDEDRKENASPDASALLPDAVNAAWLGDSSTLVYLVEEDKKQHLFSLRSVHPGAASATRLFPEAQFLAAAWLEKTSQAVAVQAGVQASVKPRLVLLDPASQDLREIAPLDGYFGGLSVSPSGKQVAYFRDPEHFEARSLADPRHVQGLHLLTGAYSWSPDESRILLKSAPARKSGTLQWIRLSDGSAQDLFHGLAIHEVAISPDGQLAGIISPGKRTLSVYPLSALQ